MVIANTPPPWVAAYTVFESCASTTKALTLAVNPEPTTFQLAPPSELMTTLVPSAAYNLFGFFGSNVTSPEGQSSFTQLCPPSALLKIPGPGSAFTLSR